MNTQKFANNIKNAETRHKKKIEKPTRNTQKYILTFKAQIIHFVENFTPIINRPWYICWICRALWMYNNWVGYSTQYSPISFPHLPAPTAIAGPEGSGKQHKYFIHNNKNNETERHKKGSFSKGIGNVQRSKIGQKK